MWLVAGTFGVLAVVARRSAARRRGATRALGALVAGGLAFVPWLPVLLYQSAHTGTPWAGPMRPTSVVAVALTALGGGSIGSTFTDSQLIGGLLLVLMLLGVFGVALDRRRVELLLATAPQFRAEAAVIAATFLLAMAAMYASRSTFDSRYAATVVPLVLLLVAGGMSRFRDPRVLAGVLAGMSVLFALGAAFNVRAERTQAFEVAGHIAERSHPGDVVLFCPDQLAPAALRVLPAGLDTLAFPHSPAVPDGWPVDRVDWSDYVKRNKTDVDIPAYTRAVVDHAGPARQIFVVSSDSYKTHEGTCQQVMAGLSGLRGIPEVLATADGVAYYENESLAVFAAR
jgi:mannosyltransferase